MYFQLLLERDMFRSRKIWIGILIIGGISYGLWTRWSKKNMFDIQGQTMGHISYRIRYFSDLARVNPQAVDSLLYTFNQVFSTYEPTSEISRFNQQDTLTFHSSWWLPLLQESQRVYRESAGAFDPTVTPLLAAYGLQEDTDYVPYLRDSIAQREALGVDSLLQYVGFEKLYFSAQGMSKKIRALRLDMSAIAKGYAVDLVAEYLEHLEVQNYMVEVGGELRVKGVGKQHGWRIGIEDPRSPWESKVAAIVRLQEGAVATSGSYRNYRKVGAYFFTHIIHPKSGWPVQHNLLSASVWAPRCVRADALATACMVVGTVQAQALLTRLPHVEGLLLYTDEQGTLRSYTSSGWKQLVEKSVY